MTSWTLSIPSVTPSLNETRRMHWAAIKRAETVLEMLCVSWLLRRKKLPTTSDYAPQNQRLPLVENGSWT